MQIYSFLWQPSSFSEDTELDNHRVDEEPLGHDALCSETLSHGSKNGLQTSLRIVSKVGKFAFAETLPADT